MRQIISKSRQERHGSLSTGSRVVLAFLDVVFSYHPTGKSKLGVVCEWLVSRNLPAPLLKAMICDKTSHLLVMTSDTQGSLRPSVTSPILFEFREFLNIPKKRNKRDAFHKSVFVLEDLVQVRRSKQHQTSDPKTSSKFSASNSLVVELSNLVTSFRQIEQIYHRKVTRKITQVARNLASDLFLSLTDPTEQWGFGSLAPFVLPHRYEPIELHAPLVAETPMFKELAKLIDCLRRLDLHLKELEVDDPYHQSLLRKEFHETLKRILFDGIIAPIVCGVENITTVTDARIALASAGGGAIWVTSQEYQDYLNHIGLAHLALGFPCSDQKLAQTRSILITKYRAYNVLSNRIHLTPLCYIDDNKTVMKQLHKILYDPASEDIRGPPTIYDIFVNDKLRLPGQRSHQLQQLPPNPQQFLMQQPAPMYLPPTQQFPPTPFAPPPFLIQPAIVHVPAQSFYLPLAPAPLPIYYWTLPQQTLYPATTIYPVADGSISYAPSAYAQPTHVDSRRIGLMPGLQNTEPTEEDCSRLTIPPVAEGLTSPPPSCNNVIPSRPSSSRARRLGDCPPVKVSPRRGPEYAPEILHLWVQAKLNDARRALDSEFDIRALDYSQFHGLSPANFGYGVGFVGDPQINLFLQVPNYVPFERATDVIDRESWRSSLMPSRMGDILEKISNLYPREQPKRENKYHRAEDDLSKSERIDVAGLYSNIKTFLKSDYHMLIFDKR